MRRRSPIASRRSSPPPLTNVSLPARYNRGPSQPMFVSAIIAAGGRSVRFGGHQPKQLVSVGGRTLLDRTVSLFLGHPRIDEVIVALPSELISNPPECVRRSLEKPLRIVAGGGRRQDSVANAFGAIAD